MSSRLGDGSEHHFVRKLTVSGAGFRDQGLGSGVQAARVRKCAERPASAVMPFLSSFFYHSGSQRCAIQKSMSLKYKPFTEPLHISFSGLGFRV